jgi:hypothetical protein
LKPIEVHKALINPHSIPFKPGFFVVATNLAAKSRGPLGDLEELQSEHKIRPELVTRNGQLTGAKRREWMGMGVAGIIIHSYCGSFPKIPYV